MMYLFLMLLSIRENNITTYLILPPANRRKPFLFNTLNLGQGTLGQLPCFSIKFVETLLKNVYFVLYISLFLMLLFVKIYFFY